MADNNEGMRLTAREWFAARMVLAIGFAVAIAVAAYFTWVQHQQAEAAAAARKAQIQAEELAAEGPTPAQAAAEANARAGVIVCAMEILNAKNAGIVPAYSQLSSLSPRPTNVRGRYVCTAATQVAKYAVAADLLCRNLQDKHCINVVSVTRDDGTVLYQRK